MRVLLAPDKFKGSLTAATVAESLEQGLTSTDDDIEVVRLPVADGGDGTVDAAVAAGWEPIAVATTGPTGAAVTTTYARRGDVAVVELASAVGIQLLAAPDALGATTYGLGTVIAHAVASGATQIVIGLGGSASTDGGAGMLQALGARIVDADGHDIACGGAGLRSAVSIDTSGLSPAIYDATFVLACDVDNPLLGPTGATRVYAPQKGATTRDLVILEDAMQRWASVVADSCGRDVADMPGSGAAGGTAFGALAVLGAVIRPGIATVLELIDFPAHLAAADLVVTGEGSLDRQSLHGKAPIGVADAARAVGVPVVTVSGRKALSDDDLRAHGIVASYALTDLEPDPRRCMRDAATLLARVGQTIASTSFTLEGAS